MTAAARALCRRLPLPVKPQWRNAHATREEDGQDSLSLPEMQAVIARQAEEARQRRDPTRQEHAAREPCKEMHAFWLTLGADGSVGPRKKRVGVLTPCCLVGMLLESHTALKYSHTYPL